MQYTIKIEETVGADAPLPPLSYLRRVECSDLAFVIGNIDQALNKKPRKPRSDKGTVKGAA